MLRAVLHPRCQRRSTPNRNHRSPMSTKSKLPPRLPNQRPQISQNIKSRKAATPHRRCSQENPLFRQPDQHTSSIRTAIALKDQSRSSTSNDSTTRIDRSDFAKLKEKYPTDFENIHRSERTWSTTTRAISCKASDRLRSSRVKLAGGLRQPKWLCQPYPIKQAMPNIACSIRQEAFGGRRESRQRPQRRAV